MFRYSINESTKLRVVAGGVNVSDGLYIGDDTGTPPAIGTLILDQGALDGVILECISSDMDDSNQGMNTDNTYFQIQKIVAASGGAWMKGASEDVYGIAILGSANTATATKSAAANAPVLIVGQVDNAAVGTSNNAIALRSGQYTRWIMQGDGEVYMDGTNNESQWDEEDDVSLIRASMGKGLGVIQGKWDEFVSRNRQDLIDLGIVTDTGFVSQQKMMKLQNGAIWQLHQRIAELEDQIGNIHQRHISG